MTTNSRSKKRRRGNHSDWIHALQQSRVQKKLRNDSSNPLSLDGREPEDNRARSEVECDTLNRDCESSFHTLEHPPVSTEENSFTRSLHPTNDVRPDRVHDNSNQSDNPNINRSRRLSFPIPVLDETVDVEELSPIDHTTFQCFQEGDMGEEQQDLLETSLSGTGSHITPDTSVPTQSNVVSEEESGIEPQLQSGYCTGTSMQEENLEIQDVGTDRSQRKNADISYLQQIRRMWECRLNLKAVVSVVGSVRLTVHQYQYTRDLLTDECATETMPPYSRVYRYFRDIIRWCLPQSLVVMLPKKANSIKNTTRRTEYSDSEQDDLELDTSQQPVHRLRMTAEEGIDGKEKVRVFLPSSWAKHDVATSTVFAKMYPSFPNAEESEEFSPLEFSKIVQHRQEVTNSCDYILADMGGQQVLCSPGSVLKISVQSRKPNFSTNFTIQSAAEGYYVTASIAATWCVGASGMDNPSYHRALDTGSLTTVQRSVLTYLKSGVRGDSEHHQDESAVLPGDICTLLRPELAIHESDPVPVIVHRFWKYEDGIPSIAIFWFDGTGKSPKQNETQLSQPCLTHDALESHVVTKVSCLATSATQSAEQREIRQRQVRSYGKLSSGIPFVIYRILLYCDDFQKSSQMSPQGSAGGCYFLPLSLPPEARRTTSAVRIISLTPPGVSTNEVLHLIVDDLVNTSVSGVDGRTPTGKAVKIFIDVLGFVGDYPASSGVVDVIGHVGRAPCTLCSFRRLQDADTEGSKFGYATSVHANNSTFLRHGERHVSLRKSKISDTDATRLGLVNASKASDRECPLLYLQRTLQSRAKEIPVTNMGEPVISGLFDAFRCNVIAPDHLLTGLTKNIVNAVYMSLPSDELRCDADIYICAALRENGLLTQKEVFNSKKKKLHGMSLSCLYCVLLVSAPVFKILTCQLPEESIVKEAVQLLQYFQRLVAFTYWWPTRELDGEEAETLVHRKKLLYFRELKFMSKHYVESVNRLCKKSLLVRKHLDKPNLHRLIELYEHTIPAFGHVREFFELVFESAHQPLKRCIARSNNRDAHISAVEHCVANDWQGRLAAMHADLFNADASVVSIARRGIRRLLLGEKADLLDDNTDHTFIAETDKMLEALFGPALVRQLHRDERVANFCAVKTSIWAANTAVTLHDLCEYAEIDKNVLQSALRIAKRWLEALYPASTETDGGAKEFETFRGAKRMRTTTSGRTIGRTRGHDTVWTHNVVQAYLDERYTQEKVLKSSSAMNVKLCLFVVVAVLQRKGDPPWALCLRCIAHKTSLQVCQEFSEDSFQLLQLSPDIRRVAVYHVCQEKNGPQSTCTVDQGTRTVKHSTSALSGAMMYLQRRVNGYPPRMA